MPEAVHSWPKRNQIQRWLRDMTMGSHPSAKLIRLYCDGELSPEQVADFEKQLLADPGAKRAVTEQIEVERRLRGCVDSAIKSHCPCAPKDLDLRIKVLFSQVNETSGDVVGRIGREQTRQRLPQRANIFAIAATLALIAGAVLFGIFGRTIDETVAPPVDLVASAAISASEPSPTQR